MGRTERRHRHENRWDQARWLLHDNTVDTGDPVAGLLVLLYAQTAATISELTVNHVQMGDQQVRLRLGREPILIPAPLDNLLRELVENRFGHAAVGRHCDTPWLFPGGRPGQSLSAFRIAERLRHLGIQSSRARSAALFQLAADLPAAILARTLGIHISVAATWQRACAGDWLSYAAEVSRRTTPEKGAFRQLQYPTSPEIHGDLYCLTFAVTRRLPRRPVRSRGIYGDRAELRQCP